MPSTKLIVQGSRRVEWYSPLLGVGRRPGREGARQLRKPGEDQSPHLALANLRLDDEDAVLAFVRRWGPLGLADIPVLRRWHPAWEPPPDAVQELKLADTPSEWFSEDGLPCEPLPAFVEQARRFQEVVIPLAVDGGTTGRTVNDFTSRAQPLLAGVTQLPVLEGGNKVLRDNILSLLAACYRRVALDWAGPAAGFRRCRWSKCQRIFLAAYQDDFFCSLACDKAAQSAGRADRTLARELLGLEKAGTITRDQRRQARAEIAARWKAGMRQEAQLREGIACLTQAPQPARESDE
jgi:hypothetical protein